jgi:hypothetical protein
MSFGCISRMTRRAASATAAGLHKDDVAGMMLLIQRVISEIRLAEDRQHIAEEREILRKKLAGSQPP